MKNLKDLHNTIVGELVIKEKYQFIDPRLISAIVTDTLAIVEDRKNKIHPAMQSIIENQFPILKEQIK